MIDLYVSWPAVSHSDSFIFFWIMVWGFCDFRGGVGRPITSFSCLTASLLLLLLLLSCVELAGSAEEGEGSEGMFKLLEAGGPTGTMREPNSTPMVTS